MQQGTYEWKVARLACITGTRFKQTVGSIQSRCTLIDELVAEREMLKRGEPYNFPEIHAENLEHGKEWEDRAIAEYQMRQFIDYVERPALITHPKYKFIKYSPDFIEKTVDPTESYECLPVLGEVKCPVKRDIHLAYLTKCKYQQMPDDHIDQLQGGLWVTGYKIGKFLTYHNEFPIADQLGTAFIERDNRRIALIESACLEIWEHVLNVTKPKVQYTSIPKLFPPKEAQQ